MPSLSFPALSMPGMRRSGLPVVIFSLSLALAGCAGGHNNNTANTLPDGKIGPSTLNVADAAIAGGDPNMALNVSQSILASDPDNVDALVHEGQAYYALNRCPAAEAAFQQALKADPKSADAETGLGRCLLKVDPKSAETAFLAATQDDPGNAAAFSDLGIARDLQDNFAGAAQAYQQSLALNAGSIATSVNLGVSMALSGQGEEALQYLGPIATGQQATPKIREDYALALVAAGRQDDARQVLAIDLTPDQVNTAMQAYQNLVSQSITAPPPPAPVAATQPVVQTAPVSTTTVTTSSSAPVMLAPASSPTPADPPANIVAAAPSVPVPAPASPPHHIASAPPQTMPAATITPVAAAVPAPAAVQAVQPVRSPAPAAKAPPETKMAESAPPPQPKPAPPKPASSMPEPAAPAMASTPTTDEQQPETSHAAVQIAALNSADAAHAEWHLVSSKAPSLFAGKSPEISKVAVNGQTFYRLRVTGFANRQDAAQFCSQLNAAGGTCVPANF